MAATRSDRRWALLVSHNDGVAGSAQIGHFRAVPSSGPCARPSATLVMAAGISCDGVSEREALHEVADAGEAVPWRGGRPGWAAA